MIDAVGDLEMGIIIFLVILVQLHLLISAKMTFHQFLQFIKNLEICIREMTIIKIFRIRLKEF